MIGSITNYAMCVVSKLYGVDQWRTTRIHLSNQGFKTGQPSLTLLIPILCGGPFGLTSESYRDTVTSGDEILPQRGKCFSPSFR